METEIKEKIKKYEEELKELQGDLEEIQQEIKCDTNKKDNLTNIYINLLLFHHNILKCGIFFAVFGFIGCTLISVLAGIVVVSIISIAIAIKLRKDKKTVIDMLGENNLKDLNELELKINSLAYTITIKKELLENKNDEITEINNKISSLNECLELLDGANYNNAQNTALEQVELNTLDSQTIEPYENEISIERNRKLN